MLKVPLMVVGYLLLFMLKAHKLAFLCSHTSTIGRSSGLGLH